MRTWMILGSAGGISVVILTSLLQRRVTLEAEVSGLEAANLAKEAINQFESHNSVLTQEHTTLTDDVWRSLRRADWGNRDTEKALARLPILAVLGDLSRDQLKSLAQEILSPDTEVDSSRYRKLREIRDEIFMILSELEPHWVMLELEPKSGTAPTHRESGHAEWMTAFSTLIRQDAALAINHFEGLEFDAYRLGRPPLQEAANLTLVELLKNQPERALALYLKLDKLEWSLPSTGIKEIESLGFLHAYERGIAELPVGQSRDQITEFILLAVCRVGGVQEAIVFLEAVAPFEDERGRGQWYYGLRDPEFQGPEKASTILSYLQSQDAEQRTELLRSYLTGWIWHDLEAPGKWVKTLRPGADRDAAIQGLLLSLGERDLEAINEWLPLISDAEIRARYSE